WEVLPDGEEAEVLWGHLTEVGAPVAPEVDEYPEAHGHCYAVVDVVDEGAAEGTVAKVHYDVRDSGDPDLVSVMEEITGPGQHWVYVPGGCSPGDEVRIDDDGCAVVVE